MGQVFKIDRENKEVEQLVKFLSDYKADIKDIICIIRHRNGDMNLLDNASFETKCSGVKMLDYSISQDLAGDNEEDYDEDDEDEEDEDSN